MRNEKRIPKKELANLVRKARQQSIERTKESFKLFCNKYREDREALSV